ncbi:MAG: hypothetical protein ACRCYO_16580 [Bacteroidia bacterium]
MLEFSQDTVVFDTVFTTVGSTTRLFKVFNRSNRTISISSLRLAGGSSSNFRINVDGTPLWSTGDVRIAREDSMFIFVDVTVDPNNSNSPLMISDAILFTTNGNEQKVILNAVGQDAHFHYREVLDCNEVWTNDKPHVIYGYAIIPSCCQLTIQAGTRVHLHQNAILAADSCASLKVMGTQASPVTFQGDRLEAEYNEEPGQWGYIWLSTNSKDNEIDWAVIKNGTVGVLCDSIGASANPTLRITNTIIRNMTLAGIFGRDSYIYGDNVLVNNCAQYCAALVYGGRYQFRHSTFGNYWDIDNRTSPALAINNWYEDANENIQRRHLTQADFLNCIIYGDLENEVVLDSNTTGGFAFNYRFSHSLLKTDVNTSNGLRFIANQYNLDPQFLDVGNNNLRLGGGSPARNLGDVGVGMLIPIDLAGNGRTLDSAPDAGAFEGQ